MVTIRNLGERLILLTLVIKQMKKKLILNKEILPILCTFLKTVELYSIKNHLMKKTTQIRVRPR